MCPARPQVVLYRSLTLLAFTTPELLWERLNPFEDPRRRWMWVLALLGNGGWREGAPPTWAGQLRRQRQLEPASQRAGCHAGAGAPHPHPTGMCCGAPWASHPPPASTSQ